MFVSTLLLSFLQVHEAVVLPTAMAPMVAVKILQPNNGAEPAGYWGMSSSIYAKDGCEGLIPRTHKKDVASAMFVAFNIVQPSCLQ